MQHSRRLPGRLDLKLSGDNVLQRFGAYRLINDKIVESYEPNRLAFLNQRDASNAMFPHQPRGVLGTRSHLTGDYPFRHDIPESGRLGIEIATKDGKREIAVGHDSGQAILIGDEHRADMVVCHCARGLISRRPYVQDDHPRSSKLFERHGVNLLFC